MSEGHNFSTNRSHTPKRAELRRKPEHLLFMLQDLFFLNLKMCRKSIPTR